MLDFIPDLFVRIEFRRIGWKKEHADLVTVRPDKISGRLRAMKGGIIRNDSKYPLAEPGALVHEPLKAAKRIRLPTYFYFNNQIIAIGRYGVSRR